MNYSLFIRKNGLTDGISAYEKYVKQNDSNAKSMNEKMLEQYIKRTFGLRFINSAWI